MNIDLHRRQFLQRGAALGTFGLAHCLPGIGMSAASAQALPGYRALVCVFLFGGNDGNNMVIPVGATEYAATYGAIRPDTSGINIPLASLLPVTTRFGLHPALVELQPLFTGGKLAILANTGPLVEPITDRNQYLQKTKQRPENLFSHSDQQQQWMSSVSQGDIRTGWGGRLSDRLSGANSPANTGVIVPMGLSFAGSQMFGNGVSTFPLALPQSGSFGFSGTTTPSAAAYSARLTALNTILTQDSAGPLASAAAGSFAAAIGSSGTLNPILTATTSSAIPAFAGLTSSISKQLLQVAKVIEARAALGHARDIFIVSEGGFDTHNGQLNTQQTLLRDLSQALNAFYNATVTLGVANSVTSFTLSDFGRTLKPATGSPPGSDHAWGNHHFIMGGAVNGNVVYGTFPTLALGAASPDDATNEGRWIPTTSIEQYGGALATWLGASSADLDYIFPNRGRFAAPPAILGA